jgi:hypothetical protein
MCWPVKDCPLLSPPINRRSQHWANVTKLASFTTEFHPMKESKRANLNIISLLVITGVKEINRPIKDWPPVSPPSALNRRSQKWSNLTRLASFPTEMHPINWGVKMSQSDKLGHLVTNGVKKRNQSVKDWTPLSPTTEYRRSWEWAHLTWLASVMVYLHQPPSPKTLYRIMVTQGVNLTKLASITK